MALKNGLVSKEVHLANAGFKKLPTHWSVVEVGELLSEDRGISVGVMYPGNHDPLGAPLIKVGDLIGSVINPTPEFRVTPEKHYEYRRTELEGGELLLTLVGAVGQCAVVPPSMAGWNAARAVAVIRLKDPEEAKFVRLCFLSAPLQHLMQVWANTTVQATLNLKEIKQLPLPWPPKEERQAIAHILGTLDDKIELNQQMNHTLENIARTLFKSWFIDFDPVRAKLDGRQPASMDAETAALFPAEFEDSDLGNIPKGWKTVKLFSLCDSIYSGGTPSTKEESYWNGEIPWLSSGETRNKFIITTERSITPLGVQNSSTRFAPAGTTVIASAGQGNTRGQTSLLMLDSYINQSIVALVADPSKISDSYLFFDLAGRYEQFRQISDSHSSRGSLTTKLLADIKVIAPERDTVFRFNKIVQPVIDQIQQNLLQTQSLTSIREALLPKFLSGEICVKNAEKLVEALA